VGSTGFRSVRSCAVDGGRPTRLPWARPAHGPRPPAGDVCAGPCRRAPHGVPRPRGARGGFGTVLAGNPLEFTVRPE